MDDTGALEGEGSRLHPATIMQRVIVSLPALLIFLVPSLRNPGSADWFNLAFAMLYVVAVVPFIVVYFLRFRYWITPKEMVIHSGVLTRRRRNIPIDRIQNIEIEQALLPRLFRTAKVSVYTAGSPQAEGVLEYVSVKEAGEIRRVVRELQKEIARKEDVILPGLVGEEGEGEAEGDVGSVASGQTSVAAGQKAHLDLANESESEPGDILFAMTPKRVLLTGMFKFSLLYIAFIFSGLQFFEPDPTVYIDWLLQGPLRAWSADVEAHPIAAAVLVLMTASLIGWLTGIVVSANRFHKFQLVRDGGKLHRKHGFMTLTEGTIPIRRIQTFIVRTNPVMERFGWYRLELQTLGINLKESGFQVAAPFARLEEIDAIVAKISDLSVPREWNPVSRRTIRRSFIRIAVVVAASAYGLQFVWADALWLLLLLAPGLLWSIARYKRTGFALTDNYFAVKRGIIRRMIWVIPIAKVQTVTRRSSLFQRRLGLESLYVDTPGASPMQPSDLIDVPTAESRQLAGRLYSAFRASSSAAASSGTSA